MKVTLRDQQLITKLQTYGCLTTRQIESLTFPGVASTTVLRRLRALEKERLIQKILGLESADRLWAVTQKSVDRFSFDCAKTNFPRAILEHDSLLSALRMRLEESGVVQSWVPEYAIRKRVAVKHGVDGMSRRVIPDGIVSVRIGGVNESVAVELELSNKNQNRYQQILNDYSTKKSLYAVWYIVKSNTIRKQIEHAKTNTFFDSRKTKLFFSDLEDLLKDPPNATLSKNKEKLRLKDLFECEPAHSGAHVVSVQTPAQAPAENSTNPL